MHDESPEAPQAAVASAPAPPPPAPPAAKSGGCMRGCFLYLVVLPLVLVVASILVFKIKGGVSSYLERREMEAKAEAAAENLRRAKAERFDLDATMRTLIGLDRMLSQDASSFQDYLEKQARMEPPTDVAPEVMAARADLISSLGKLYAAVNAESQREELYKEYRFSFEYLADLLRASASDVTSTLTFDRVQLAGHLDRLDSETAAKNENLNRIRELRTQMIPEFEKYSAVYFKYAQQWREFCLERDRAYLHAAEGNWLKTAQVAQQALEKSPKDRESQLLLAWSLLEGGDSVGEISREPLKDARMLIARVKEAEPELIGTCLLLEGVAAATAGDRARATECFALAAKELPRQRDSYAKLADLYATRGYLDRSEEGRDVVDCFRQLYLGGGFFSPDLQRAVLLESDETADETAVRTRRVKHFRERIEQGRASEGKLREAKAKLAEIEQRPPVTGFSQLLGFLWDSSEKWAEIARRQRGERAPWASQLEIETLANPLSLVRGDVAFVEKSASLNAEGLQVALAAPVAEEPKKGSKPAPEPASEADAAVWIKSSLAGTIDNVAIILSIRYTDMMPGESIFVLVPKTVPNVASGDERKVVDLDLRREVRGQIKGFADIVEAEALVVADQGVVRLDVKVSAGD